MESTNQVHYRSFVPVVRAPIKPEMAYPWREAANEGSKMPGSTAMDAFRPPPESFKQLKSFKPAQAWGGTSSRGCRSGPSSAKDRTR